jgi:hypothetical protein
VRLIANEIGCKPDTGRIPVITLDFEIKPKNNQCQLIIYIHPIFCV